MSLRRHNAKRDANEGIIIAALEASGCLVQRLDTPCDLLVLLPAGRGIIVVEVKTKTGTLTKDQAEFARYWPLHVIRTVEEALALVRGKRAA